MSKVLDQAAALLNEKLVQISLVGAILFYIVASLFRASMLHCFYYVLYYIVYMIMFILYCIVLYNAYCIIDYILYYMIVLYIVLSE